MGTPVERHAATRLAAASTRVADLSAEEQRLLGLLQETRHALARAREEHEFVQRSAERLGGRGAVAPETLRRTIRELGTFTVSELAAELGVSQAVARKRLDAMLCSKPPWVVSAGRALGKIVYEYVKPSEPGQAFEVQQATRPATPEHEAVASTASRTKGDGPGSGRRQRTGNKRSDEALRKAQAAGAKVEVLANNHVRVTYNGRTERVALTPSRGSAENDRRKLRKMGLPV